MKVLVCGSRRFAHPFRASLTIDARIAQLPPGTTVIHGAAIGGDTMAAQSAQTHGLTVEAFPVTQAEYKQWGKQAPLKRNLRMLDEKPDLVLAFWDGSSPGTKYTFNEAAARGIPVEVMGPL